MITKSATAVLLVLLIGLVGCGSGVIHGLSNNNSNGNGNPGDPCTGDEECLEGECVPYAGGHVCAASCTEGTDCVGDFTCTDLGQLGWWCLPGSCVPACTDRCCGDDGCGGQCPDTCAGSCDPGGCSCVVDCSPVDAIQPCSAHGACSGTQTCQSDNTWSGCDSPSWQCTSPGSSETCQVGACGGNRECLSDCSWGDCQEDCPGTTSCCASGCLDLTSDANNCGECGRVCDQGTLTCYEGACPEGCARNGSEICDDEGFQVPAPPVEVYLVCDNANGGVAYISTNTGPPMISDGVPRCQGWEEQGLNAWDYLDYIATLNCTSAGLMLQVDLSAYVGQHLHFGSHDQPGGGGHMTMVCIAFSP